MELKECNKKRREYREIFHTGMKKLGKMPGFTKLLNSITCYLYYYVVGIFDHTLQIPECIKYVKNGRLKRFHNFPDFAPYQFQGTS